MITRNALIKRINRKLAPQHERIEIPRGWNYTSLGCCRVDTWGNRIVDTHVDLVVLATDLGVLHPNEKVAA